MLRFLRIVYPKNTKLSFPRLQSTIRVFARCNVNPSQSTISPIRPSASLACDSVRHSEHNKHIFEDRKLSARELFGVSEQLTRGRPGILASDRLNYHVLKQNIRRSW